MDQVKAILALSALAQDTRLGAFRLLVARADTGALAGEVSDAMGVRQNTMSGNLSILSQAGLIRSQREGRAIRYFADLDRVRSLLAYLMEDCCGGRPGLCQPLLAEVLPPLETSS